MEGIRVELPDPTSPKIRREMDPNRATDQDQDCQAMHAEIQEPGESGKKGQLDRTGGSTVITMGGGAWT